MWQSVASVTPSQESVPMILNVLGCAGSYPGPGEPCSGYLVRTQNHSLLLDLGNGAMTNLYSVLQPELLSSIVISHGHMDHFADMVGLYHYLKFVQAPKQPIELYCTNDFAVKFKALIGHELGQVSSVFAIRMIESDKTVSVGDLEIVFKKANHPVETYVARISENRKVLCYGADGDVSDNLIESSTDVDLLLCESTWSKKDHNHPFGLHMDANDIANVAKLAKPKKTLITHIAHPNSREHILWLAKQNYNGDISLARADQQIEI